MTFCFFVFNKNICYICKRQPFDITWFEFRLIKTKTRNPPGCYLLTKTTVLYLSDNLSVLRGLNLE